MCLSITTATSCHFFSVEGVTIDAVGTGGSMLVGLFGYAMELDDVCSTWSHQVAAGGMGVTSLQKFAQFAGVFSCLLGFAATVLLFLAFFIRRLLNKATWRIALPILLISAGVFQSFTFALADSACKCPEGTAPLGCVVTCTLQDGGNRSLAASILYLFIGVLIIFYPRRTDPMIGFVYAPVESNKTDPDIETPTTTLGALDEPRGEDPFISKRQGAHESFSDPLDCANFGQEQFNPNWEGMGTEGADLEAPTQSQGGPFEPGESLIFGMQDVHASSNSPQGRANAGREQFNSQKAGADVADLSTTRADKPPVKKPSVSNGGEAHKCSALPQGRVISSQDHFNPSLEATNKKVGADAAAPTVTRGAPDKLRDTKPVISTREPAHEPASLPQGRAISGQDQTGLEGTHEFSSVRPQDTHASSDDPRRRSHGHRVTSKGIHRHHRPKEEVGQDAEATT